MKVALTKEQEQAWADWLGKKEKEENKRIFNCKCGKQITVYVNVYDNSNSGMGHCECGATMYIN